MFRDSVKSTLKNLIMNRRILTLLLTIFILTGLAFSVVPYLSSLKQKETLREGDKIDNSAQPSIDIEEVKAADDR